MLRRFVLVGIMVVVVESGSMLQIILGTLATAIFLLLQLQARPYKSPFEDQLASAASFSLLVFFLASYAFKDAALVDLPAIQAKMSIEQKSTYVVETRMLTFILLGSLIGTLLISCAIFIIMIYVERQHRMREEAARLLRKLWYSESNTEALPVSMPEWPSYLTPKEECPPNQVGPFHIFLSHNWAQGQDQMVKAIPQTHNTETPVESLHISVPSVYHAC